MATRKAPTQKPTSPLPPAAGNTEAETALDSSAQEDNADEAIDASFGASSATLPTEADSGPAEPSPGQGVDGQEGGGHAPRFHFFIIDAGWKSTAAKVLRENFGMIREFQNSDPLYVLNRRQSIDLIRANPDLIGKDPVILVHDLHAQGGRGESGYHGFRLCLGLINDGQQALAAMQKFLRFIQQHRHSDNIEQDIRDKLHRKGMESAIEVIRESVVA